MKHYIAAVLMAVLVLTLLIGRAFQDISHPDQYETPGFNYVQQPDNITCGPTSTTMLLRYYGKNVNISQVEAETRTRWFTWGGDSIGMTGPEFVERAMRKFGVPATMRRGSLSNLEHYVADGRPCVVLVRSGEKTWHYVVVIGFTKKQIILADPGPGVRWEIPVENFIGCWGFTTDMEGNICGHADPIWGRIDPIKSLLWAGDILPNTMIVPDRNK